ncbi:Coiled-coil domain-containing protein [Penicillium diatomitis]|uniref:Coiled-coil domain-containing protein n=1 Tax=Penicillium diatomitis TaxID=2819901 RepID=A0A9W9XMF6_9EURO|nr:Coiled-coil domain-containing protein [Penicillium diatomitis]KAJ5495693.1 Coiled-coil domain-containing protein [Penicillium diatomitis]
MQGFNMGRYVPPDQEGITSANKLAGKHPLGARARHLQTKGALIVRFEMPFAVWCTTCKPHETIIGQGVRFNAEKKKIGNYYSTPIFSFRMKHTVCGGWIEIHTDPKNTAYVVVEGGRKRDVGDDKPAIPGEIVLRGHLEDVKEKNEDPLAKIEGKVEDKRRAQSETSRILELQHRQSRDWDDPYEKSKRLRRTFRAERKGLEKLEANREALKDKMSLGIELVNETEEDRQRAGMVDFGDDTSLSDAGRATRTRPMFENFKPKDSKSDKKRIGEHNELLRSELKGNTRATVDPFLKDLADSQDIWKPGVKRKRNSSKSAPQPTLQSGHGSGFMSSAEDEGMSESKGPEPGKTTEQGAPPASVTSALVGYDSDTSFNSE